MCLLIEPITRRRRTGHAAGLGRVETAVRSRSQPRHRRSHHGALTPRVRTPRSPARSPGKTALVTGSSRGIGADTVRYFARGRCDVVINFRNKAPRAEKLATELRGLGVEALVGRGRPHRPGVGPGDVRRGDARFGGLDVLVAECIGRHGVRHGRGLRDAAQPRRPAPGARVGAAAARARDHGSSSSPSHQAHFIRTTPTMPEYEPVALSKRAGEDALRERIPRSPSVASSSSWSRAILG